jgi:hypothetical protein
MIQINPIDYDDEDDGFQSYTVQPGDSVAKIAYKFDMR